MKDFDLNFTTESENDFVLDNILGEFQSAYDAPENDVDTFVFAASDAELPVEDNLPELPSEDFQSSDFSYSESFTSGYNVDKYVDDDFTFDESLMEEEDDVAIYVPGRHEIKAAPEYAPAPVPVPALYEEEPEPPAAKPSAVSSMADEARRYIAGIQGAFGRSRSKRQRKSLAELQSELDEETFARQQEMQEEPALQEPAYEGAPAYAEEPVYAEEPAYAEEPVYAEEPAYIEEPQTESRPDDFDFNSVYESYSEQQEQAGPIEPLPEDIEYPEVLAEEPVEEKSKAKRRNKKDYVPVATDKLSDKEINRDNIIEPEYRKDEIEIDSRFNLGGFRNRTKMHFGNKAIDTGAEENYKQSAQRDEAMSHWIVGEEEPVVDETVMGKRRLSKKKQKQLEREEMLRRQKQSEEQVAEEFDDTDAEPAEYAEEKIPEDIHFNIDEDAFPPTFRAYLSSIIASAVLRLRGTNTKVTNSTMVDTDEDLGAELSPAAAYKYYGSFIPFQRLRLRISMFVIILLCYLSVGLPIPGMLQDYRVAAAGALAMQLTVMLLSLDVVTNAILNMFRLKFGVDSLAVVSCLFTLIDAALVAKYPSAAPHMPLCALTCVSLYGVTHASAMNTRALRKAIRVPAIGKYHYAVTGEMKFKDKQLTLLKSQRSAKGFVRRAEEVPPDEVLFNKLSIIILILSVLFTMILCAVHKNASDFIYVISAVLAPGVPCTALVAFALPFLLGTNRIFKSGAAIAGWSGLCDIGMSKNLIVTDRDLFPENAVSIKEAKIFSDESAEKVISYAGSLICASGSCISSCFAKLMEENGCTMQMVNEFEYLSGGGMRGLIDGHQVLCGSTDLMRLMNVRIPYRLTGKTAVLLAIDGVIYGIFTIEYKPLPQVRKALVELMRSSRHPVFAIRDFNVNPEMLHNCFDLATDGYDFPPYVERFKLSEASKTRSKDGKISAVVCNEGLAPLTDAADVGRSMYISIRINLVITAVSAFVSMLVAFVRLLTAGSAPVGFLLLIMLVWIIPVYLVSLYVLKP